MVQAQQQTELKRAAIEQMQRFAGALVAGDADALDGLLSPDFTYTHANAWVEPRADLLGAIRGGRHNTRTDPEGLSVRVHGGAAIVAGVVHMRVGPPDALIEFDSRFTGVWAGVDGALRLVAYHSTRVPAE